MKPLHQRLLTLFSALFIVTSIVSAQTPADDKKQEKINSFSKEKLKEKWGQFKNDKPFTNLLAEVEKKGFKKLEVDNTSWGYEGEVTDKNGKNRKVLFCIYDFVKTVDGKKQNVAVVWREVDKKAYKAYVVLPPGETNMEKALDGASEWYADEKGEIQKANSWGTCFLKCVKTGGTAPGLDADIVNGKLKVGGKTYTISCPGFCMFSAACAATALGVGIALAETGVGLAMAIIAAGACGLPCSSCFGMCAIGCL